MPKLTIDAVIKQLNAALIPPATIRKVVEGLNAEAEKAEAAKAPRAKGKTQLVILASDPKGVLKGIDIVGWVFQTEDGMPAAEVKERINKAAFDYNASKKGRLHPVKTVGEAIEAAPRAFWKREEGGRTTVKTKEPILIVTTDNQLPKVGV